MFKVRLELTLTDSHSSSLGFSVILNSDVSVITDREQAKPCSAPSIEAGGEIISMLGLTDDYSTYHPIQLCYCYNEEAIRQLSGNTLNIILTCLKETLSDFN